MSGIHASLRNEHYGDQFQIYCQLQILTLECYFRFHLFQVFIYSFKNCFKSILMFSVLDLKDHEWLTILKLCIKIQLFPSSSTIELTILPIHSNGKFLAILNMFFFFFLITLSRCNPSYLLSVTLGQMK